MTVSQTSFRVALLDPVAAIPDGLLDANSGPAGVRFSVYRNNVVVSLKEALATAFPLLRKLLGSEAFEQLAGLYVRAHPPNSPLMMYYGKSLPEFLRRFEPLKHIGYLPDCARLDLAMRQSYHASDAKPFDARILSSGDPDALMVLAPSTRIVRSDWPLHDIWRFNMDPSAPKPRVKSQDVLVTRPVFDPHPHLLPIGAADWLENLGNGASIATATQNVLSDHPQFDLTETLTLALTTNALSDHTAKDI